MAEEFDFSGVADMIGELLGSEDGKQQLQNVLAMFGGEKEEKSAPGAYTGGINPNSVEMIMKMQQIMSLMNNQQTNKQTALLNSLRELLRPERREKVDNAVKFLSIGKAIEAFRKIEGV